jgi:tetratricopeptide (TPR) repeat protein
MADLTGQTLGKYQLLERLGRGGMADVYKGFQPGLDRYVAIKVLHPHLAEEEDFITRFKREARAVASLRHPNIIQVFDFDVQGENYYMAMEYVEGGRSLKELLEQYVARNEAMPVEQALDLVAKLADALDYAHKQGMVHRDIKPSNVLVPSVDHPVLSDFGIARLMGQSGLTASGAMIGTPAYMSPEQGRGELADERSDIYALGIVLYELVTGHPPYDADTPYGVILKHINDPLISPRKIIATMPEAAERIVLKCLAKNPADRYASAGQMRDALRQALDDFRADTLVSQPTEPLGATIPATAPAVAAAAAADEGLTLPAIGAAAPTTVGGLPTAEVPKKKRRGWVWAVVGLIVLVGAALGIFFGLGFNNPAGRMEARAYRLRDQGDLAGARASFRRAYELSDEPWYLEQAAAISVRMEDYDAALQAYDRILEVTLGDPNYMIGRGYVQWRLGQHREAASVALRALELDPEMIEAYYLLGLAQREAGDLRPAMDAFRHLEPIEETWRYDDPYFNIHYGHEIHFDMALTACRMGEVDRALDLIEQSLEVEGWWVQPYVLRADIMLERGDRGAAREDLLQALDIARDWNSPMATMIEERIREIGE